MYTIFSLVAKSDHRFFIISKKSWTESRKFNVSGSAFRVIESNTSICSSLDTIYF